MSAAGVVWWIELLEGEELRTLSCDALLRVPLILEIVFAVTARAASAREEPTLTLLKAIIVKPLHAR